MIILASASPQRWALVGTLGVAYTIDMPEVEEGADPMANARAKAAEVAGRRNLEPGEVVVACDTEVVLDGRALGKAGDEAQAREMMTSLAGRAHEVVSALVVRGPAGAREALVSTAVHMRAHEPALIEWYLGTGEWSGRAGSYAVQGAGGALVERIDGDPSSVVGLPLPALVSALRDLGMAPFA
ncbi:MAG: Maf family protein [Miltoncostaeaceae bacterium]